MSLIVITTEFERSRFPINLTPHRNKLLRYACESRELPVFELAAKIGSHFPMPNASIEESVQEARIGLESGFNLIT